MALDFPSNPTDGQVYGNYIWSSSSGAWKSKPTVGSVTTHSPTAPTTPNPGDIWFNTNDGTSFTYYDDGNTRQWVEMMGSGISNSPLSANYVINGAMDYWQRGTPNITMGYTADRWCTSSYGTGGVWTTTKGTATPPIGFQNYLKATPTSATSINFFIGHFFETKDVIPLNGKTVTLSFQYRIPTSFTSQWSAYIMYSTGAADSQTWTPTGATSIGNGLTLTNTTSWTSASLTVTVPTTATNLAIQFQNTNNIVGTAEFNLTGVQLEVGSTATPFRRAGGTLQGELAACQRYYEIVDFGNSKSPAFVTYAPNGDTRGWIQFMVPKRVSPTGTSLIRDTWFSTSSWVTVGVTGNATNEVNTTFTVAPSGVTQYGTGLSVSAGLTAAWGVVSWGSNTGIYVYSSAEI